MLLHGNGYGLVPSRRRVLLTGLGMAPAAMFGGGGADAQTPPAVSFQLEGRTIATVGRLDAEVAAAFPQFNAASILPDFDSARQGARYDVALYRLTTTVVIPETGEVVSITGLLAMPVGAGAKLPVVSWQHGTILSFDQVPSNLVKLADPAYRLSDSTDSLETLFNVHRFAANGFAVIAADYVGKGPLRNGRREGYAVKGVTTAACASMLRAGLAALESLGVTPGRLCLHGWSQGSLNTQWLHQALRNDGLEVEATAVASPFCDITEAWSYWAGHKTFPLPDGTSSYPDVPDWVSLCMIIALGSYETYYGVTSLLESSVRPEYREMARKYWNDYVFDAESMQSFPTSKTLLVPDFFEPGTDAKNRWFLEQAGRNGVTTWHYDRPVRFYMGLADEATHPDMTIPLVAANPGFADGIRIAGASHRATFLAGLYGEPDTLEGRTNVLSWFRDVTKR